MIKVIQRFFYAWLFLTKLPAPPLPKATKEDWGRITPYFVLIGFILGGILYFFSILFLKFKFPLMFSSLLILLIWNLITGSLHLDGLMDTFDGINCQDKNRKMEAMKDSRIGAFGAIGGIFVILFKLTSLCTILLNKLFFILLITLPLARLAAVYSLSFLNKNSSQGISSSYLTAGIKKPNDFLINLFIFVIGFLFFVLFSGLRSSAQADPSFGGQVSGLILFILISFSLSLCWSYWLDNHFKGHSGDTYGALIELSEVTTLALVVILKQFFV